MQTSCSWLRSVHGPEKKEPFCKEVAREELGQGVAAESGDGEDAEVVHGHGALVSPPSRNALDRWATHLPA